MAHIHVPHVLVHITLAHTATKVVNTKLQPAPAQACCRCPWPNLSSPTACGWCRTSAATA